MTGTPDDLFDVAPLPPFAAASDAVRAALPALRPLARVSVAETALRRSIEAGGQWVPYRHDVAPYMIEPMEAVTSRRFDSIAFVGPARSSKSEGLVINPLVHAILAHPRTVAVFSPTGGAASEWSRGALDPLIENSPELAARMARGRGADTIYAKRFRGGTRLTIDWPVKSKLAQRSIALVIGTDYDAFPDDIDGDGAAFSLMRKRTESAGSRGMTIVESSPRHEVQDETWTPTTAHEAPPCDGIVSIYNAGSRGRLYWTCPDCSDLFIPSFDRLSYPDAGSPLERGAAAVMVCPHCGSVIPSSARADLNAGSRWLHEDVGGALVPLADLSRLVATASYWLPGPAAALAPWSRIVSRYIEAQEAFDRTGDEAALRAATNVELGLPYLPRARGNSSALSERALRDAATDHAWRTAPAGTAFITAAVDTQVGRFVVQVEAWMPGLERVVIDRFDIFEAPADAPGQGDGPRRIDPARYAEDWAALLALADREYPVAGAGHTLRPVAVVVDANGEGGVTPNAYAFWRRARLSHPRRFYILKGEGGDRRKRAVLRRPETSHSGKAHAARDVVILFVGTDRLKDEVAASLLREAGGARKLSVSRFAPAQVFSEYAAERRGPKGWNKRAGVQRNEALDLSCYNLGLAIALEAEAINWDRPPLWAAPGPSNMMARAIAPDPAPDGAPATDQPAAPTAPSHGRWAVRRPRKQRW